MEARKLQELFHAADADRPIEVTVIANDYRYDGWLVAVFPKRGGLIRAVVEDICGRLFIHNATQLRQKDPP